jgi:hypothetical protein
LRKFNGRELKVLFVLSIVVPTGLLATFRLAGIIKEPATITETITLEPVKWEFEKAFSSTYYPLWFNNPEETYISNSYKQGSTLMTCAVIPAGYLVNFGQYDGSSMFNMRLNVTVTITDGFVESVCVFFHEQYENSQLELFGWPHKTFWELENLTITDVVHCFYQEEKLESGEKAFIKTVCQNSPKHVQINGWTHWILRAPENMSQQLEVTAEVTYFNGTDYVKVVLPISLSLVADVGGTFETARTITPGNYTANINAKWDTSDCYKIWLVKGQRLSVQTFLRGAGANLTLHSPDERIRESIALERNYDVEPKLLGEIIYTVDVEGYWYMKIYAVFDFGTYNLKVHVEEL